MPSQTPYHNPWGWPLPLTDAILDESLYAPLDQPAESVAERLIWLANTSFDVAVWGPTSGRVDTYWSALAGRVTACTLMAADVAEWWEKLMETLPGVPLREAGLLHEKNILVRPATLNPTPVPDAEVLHVLRTYPLDLTDRARATLRLRGNTKRARAKEGN